MDLYWKKNCSPKSSVFGLVQRFGRYVDWSKPQNRIKSRTSNNDISDVSMHSYNFQVSSPVESFKLNWISAWNSMPTYCENITWNNWRRSYISDSKKTFRKLQFTFFTVTQTQDWIFSHTKSLLWSLPSTSRPWIRLEVRRSNFRIFFHFVGFSGRQHSWIVFISEKIGYSKSFNTSWPKVWCTACFRLQD